MKLIDADELIVMEFEGIRFVPEDFIKDAPTIDAVEVVRCKDCKHGAIAYPLFCRKGKALATIEDGNNFCSYGERIEE